MLPPIEKALHSRRTRFAPASCLTPPHLRAVREEDTPNCATQPGYRILSKPGSQIVLYAKEEVDLTALGGVEISDRWISVGNLVVGAYLSPSLTINLLREQLLNIPRADNIIGDFNYTNRHKRRVLLETLIAQNLQECLIKGKT